MSWRVVKIGELIENFSVKAKDFNVDVSTLDFFGVSNTEGITNSKYAAEDKANDYKIMEKGCFAYNPYRVNVGSIAMLNEDIIGLISPAYVVFKVKEKSIIPELLLKFLKSSEGLRQIKLHARGTVRQALRFSDLCQIKISLPDYDEQIEFYKKISNTEIESSVLSTQLRHQLDLVKQLRQSFLREAMQGRFDFAQQPDANDEPATELLAKIKAEKEQLIKEKKIRKPKPLPPITKEEIPFEIPENWVWCRLGDLSSIVRGGSPRPAGDKRFYEGNIPFLKVGDLTGYEGKFCDKHTFTIKEAGLYKTRFVEANTLMLTNSGATLGVPRICTFPTTFNDGIAAFLGIDLMNKEFLFYFLRNKSEYFLQEASRGQGQPNLNTDIISFTLLALPPLSEQKRIAAKLDELMAYCDSLEESIKNSQIQNEMLLGQVLREALEPKGKEVVI